MTVFEMMLDIEFRRQFVEKKKIALGICSDEFDKMQAYILSDVCAEHIQRLMGGDYFFNIPRMIKLRKAHSNKRRIIYRYTDQEIFLMKLMSYALHKYDYLYSDSLYSFRQNKRNSDLFQRISRLQDKSDLYVLKTDISDYGGNVNPEILIKGLKQIMETADETLYQFFAWLLTRNKYYWKGELLTGNKGAISGTPLTSFFENIYLLQVDEQMRRKSILYCRYCDDIAVFLKSKEEAKECKDILEQMLQERGLKFNQEKTVIYEPGEDVDLLGIKITEKHFDIADNSMHKIKWKMTHKRNKLLKLVQRKKISSEKAMHLMIRFSNWYFFGVKRYDRELNWVAWAFPVLTREKSLKEIDAHVQECIRVVGSGKKTNAKYRVTYKKMKEYGYKNLVHAYYHGYDVMEDQDEIVSDDSKSSRRECPNSSMDDARLL